MRTKSFPVWSPNKSLDPSPPSLPGRFGCGEIDHERDVPPRKRHCCLGTGYSEKLDACIVCEISDRRVSRCRGIDCDIHFHGECLNAELGGDIDYLVNPYCPCCWYVFVALKSRSLRDKVIKAEKAFLEYLGLKETVPVNQEHLVNNTRHTASDDESV